MFKLDDRGVTPVIGTIMIMGIMVVGMGGILLWGAPAIQAVQDQGSLAAMEGEFASLRANTDELRVRDSSRLPIVSLAAGELGFSDGTRFMLTVSTFNETCSPRILHGWLPGHGGEMEMNATNCPADRVSAHRFGSGVDRAADIDVNATRVKFNLSSGSAETGSWRFTLHDISNNALGYAFILETNQLDWSLDTQSSELNLFLEGGALFQSDRGRIHLLSQPPIYENLFGSGDYVLKMPIYVGPQVRYEAPATLQAQFTLGGNTWALGAPAYQLRYDYAGELAEAWCNTLLLRNDKITAGEYNADPAFGCESGNAEGVRSVTYHKPTNDAPERFNFELMTPRINAALYL